ncbi:hypothetical protein ANN_24030 [Periplaneta americana]|uniref:Reverse transcriptase domain-containing protein n=1 Tax=Periplaneta americana TaxID=6978 RepID=A0ABQ8S2H4_PERAM|nr:hypothetical protein ANN_24030 [Periplaneta americana]
MKFVYAKLELITENWKTTTYRLLWTNIKCFDQRTPDSDGYTRWSSSKNVKDIDPPVAQIIPRTMVQVPGAVDSDMIAKVEGARLAPNPSKDVSPSTAGPSNSVAAETTATATPEAPVDYTRKRRNVVLKEHRDSLFQLKKIKAKLELEVAEIVLRVQLIDIELAKNIKASKEIGLEINPEKTKYMIMSRDENIVRNGNIKIGHLSFEEVEKFKYLGATVTNLNDTREEIKHRINIRNACYYSVEKLLSSSLLSKNLKVRIYKTVILPVVLYGCETWTLTLKEEHRLRVFENKALRKIFGPKGDEVTGEWRKLHIEELQSSPDIIRNIKSRRLRWIGHVASMGESRNAYRVLIGRPEGKRPLGRPRRRWGDNIKMNLREVGYDDRDWINLAQDRDLWRAYVRAAMNLRSKQASQANRSSTRVCVRICVSIRRPEFECSGPQLEGPEFECSGPQLEGPEFEYSELSLKDARTCKLVSECETEVTGGQEGRREARRTGNMCPVVELTDEGMYGLCLRVVSKMTPSQVPKEMIWYMSENCQNPGSHQSWTSDDCAKVIWSDETRISIFGSEGTKYIRRRNGEALNPEYLIATMKHPVPVMIWGCTSRNGVGELRFFKGT